MTVADLFWFMSVLWLTVWDVLLFSVQSCWAPGFGSGLGSLAYSSQGWSILSLVVEAFMSLKPKYFI